MPLQEGVKSEFVNVKKTGYLSATASAITFNPNVTGVGIHPVIVISMGITYMFVASDSHSDLPVLPLLERASRHDILSFLHIFFFMQYYLPAFKLEKLLLDSVQ